jgi:molecular chaperone Hsp33
VRRIVTRRRGGTGELVLGLAAERNLRWAAVELTGVAEEARRRHDLSPVAAAALGRALAGAVLLQRISARSCRRLIVTVTGDGPLGRVVAEADHRGDLRGRVGNPAVEVPRGADGRLTVAAAVGRGHLKVFRELADGSSWESQVELVTGEIGVDLAHYLEQSEQVQSAVLVGVLEGPEGVRAAGGMVVEALPGAPAAALATLEANLGALTGVSRLLLAGSVEGLLEAVLRGLGREAAERSEVRFHCSCRRDVLLPKLVALTAEERAELADERGLIEAQCAFCGARYHFSSGELDAQ